MIILLLKIFTQLYHVSYLGTHRSVEASIVYDHRNTYLTSLSMALVKGIMSYPVITPPAGYHYQ